MEGHRKRESGETQNDPKTAWSPLSKTALTSNPTKTAMALLTLDAVDGQAPAAIPTAIDSRAGKHVPVVNNGHGNVHSFTNDAHAQVQVPLRCLPLPSTPPPASVTP